MKTHRFNRRGKAVLLITHGRTDTGWFFNVYLVGRRTEYMGRRNGRFYRRTMLRA